MDTRKSLCYLTLVFSFNVNVWVRVIANYLIGPHVVVEGSAQILINAHVHHIGECAP